MTIPSCGLVASTVILGLSASILAQGDPGAADWRSAESWVLSEHVALTSRDDFLKAGEAYFSPDGLWIIFQAVPVPPQGQDPDPFYSMYVSRLILRDGVILGAEPAILLSNPGSANTCGWFHPAVPGLVLFGSTIGPPSSEQPAGFRVGQRRYVWQFPTEMEVVTMIVPEIWRESLGRTLAEQPSYAPELGPSSALPLFEREMYDAEASWSRDGRFVLYTRVEEGRPDGTPDADIWIFDVLTEKHHPIVVAPGYDGGPFFSPDGRYICYRSDRELNDRLQLFVAELRFEHGVPVGIKQEFALTANEHVNWGPYWHPSGRFIVYSTSELGHTNYEVFAIESDVKKLAEGAGPADLRRVRITNAPGADVLPVFSDDGRHLIWTAQRGPLGPGDQRPSSQVWAARFNAEAMMRRLQD